jgi:hypothetical protein
METETDFGESVNDLYTRIRKNIPSEPGVRIPADVAAIAFPVGTISTATRCHFRWRQSHPSSLSRSSRRC